MLPLHELHRPNPFIFTFTLQYLLWLKRYQKYHTASALPAIRGCFVDTINIVIAWSFPCTFQRYMHPNSALFPTFASNLSPRLHEYVSNLMSSLIRNARIQVHLCSLGFWTETLICHLYQGKNVRNSSSSNLIKSNWLVFGYSPCKAFTNRII